MVLDVAARLAAELPEARVKVPVSGPFSIASNLVGFETLLCEVIADPEGTREALFRLVEGQERYCREVRARALEIAFFESAAAPPLLSPDLFARVELAPLKKLLRATEAIFGRASPCIIGGDTEPIIDMILETGTSYVICPCETDQAAFMAKMARRPDVMVRLNMRSAITTTTDGDELRREVDRVVRLAAGRENVCIGTGALPFEAVRETVLRARELVEAAGAAPRPDRSP